MGYDSSINYSLSILLFPVVKYTTRMQSITALWCINIKLYDYIADISFGNVRTFHQNNGVQWRQPITISIPPPPPTTSRYKSNISLMSLLPPFTSCSRFFSLSLHSVQHAHQTSKVMLHLVYPQARTPPCSSLHMCIYGKRSKVLKALLFYPWGNTPFSF